MNRPPCGPAGWLRGTRPLQASCHTIFTPYIRTGRSNLLQVEIGRAGCRLSSRWVNVGRGQVVIPPVITSFWRARQHGQAFLVGVGGGRAADAQSPAFADCQQQDKRPPLRAAAVPATEVLAGPEAASGDWHHRPAVGRTRERSFRPAFRRLRDARKELDALEAVLSRTIQENTADVFTVSQQVDKVEAARSAYNKARTVMLYRMNLVLTRISGSR